MDFSLDVYMYKHPMSMVCRNPLPTRTIDLDVSMCDTVTVPYIILMLAGLFHIYTRFQYIVKI